ncbi:MAG: hypothetical protein PUF59_09415 [Lachnospiraceae bacterium]|nr:hypothetical protein [Lachnospiraceae bacterium]
MQNAYIVIVNNKYMMRVQAESKCGAEHVVLDRFSDEINKYHVITSAQAFDSDDLKNTWFFRDYFSRCDLISMRWLEELVEDYVSTMQDLEDMSNLLIEANKMVDTKEAELEQAEKKRDELARGVNDYTAQRKHQAENLGMKL